MLKKPNRPVFSDPISDIFELKYSKEFLKQKLQEIGGNSFSFNHEYINHIKYWLDSLEFDRTNMSTAEGLHIFKNDLTEIPKCFCGKKIRYDGKIKGYGQTCSRSCNNKSPEINEKRKNTFLEKYGCESVFQNEKVKEKIKETKFKNRSFGSYRYFMNQKIPIDFSPIYTLEEIKLKLDEIGGSIFFRDEILMDHLKYYIQKNTNIDYTHIKKASEAFFIIKNDLRTIPKCVCGEYLKYQNLFYKYSDFCSSYCSANSPKTKEKRENTLSIKYGVTNFSYTEEFKNSMSEINRNLNYSKVIEPFKNIIIPLFGKEEYNTKSKQYVYPWKCLRCNCDFISEFFSSTCNHPSCPNCDKRYSNLEIIIKNFLDFYKISYEFKNRKILNNKKELDFYIKDKNLAIEVDGLYYHNESRYPADYHLQKTEECSDKGIKLIHIFTDEFLQKIKIVKSRLKYSLGLINRKIYARKCKILEIDTEKYSKFCEKYHIQGTSVTDKKIGLFYKNRLVAVMGFSKTRNSLGFKEKEENVFELIRYCSIFNFSVIGGASKLLKYFEKTYNPKKIISYADRRWSDGNLYKSIGFLEVSKTRPNYWYTDDFENRYHRFGYQKHLLKDRLDFFDPKMTEHENMLANGFLRIYDCGSIKFEKNYV